MTKPFYDHHCAYGSDICWRCVLAALFPDDPAAEIMCTHVRVRPVADVYCATGSDYL